jgi:hypothetical protein
MTLQQTKQQLIDAAQLGALAALKQYAPGSDEVKAKEAYKMVSRHWVLWHTKRGNLTPLRRGTAKNSPVYYSRLEIAALRQAETSNLLTHM